MGRQLQGISGIDLTTSYKYNEDGLRTQKTVNGRTHEYTLLGSSVTRGLSGAITGAITGAVSNAVKVSQAAKTFDKGTFSYV
ncbi:MAG: hypothetical protein ACOX85_11265 [Candidatus Pararuminococcus gallinarum]|nr:hypothetical protein [Bacillota bacterium]